ncbi:MAG: signal peptidase II [Clostridia bacterium]|nr:signal peptidase II [Clostridia bacterium]
MLSYILAIITGIVALGADQLTKYLVTQHFVMGESYEFLPGFLGLTYIHNTGGAWGMLGGYTWLLLSITIVVMLVCIALLLKCGVKDKLLFWAIVLVLSGGLGNMIDRIFRGGNVIDFLNFQFITFPVFNIADCAVVLGACLLLLHYFVDMIKESKQNRINPDKFIADSKKNEKD